MMHGYDNGGLGGWDWALMVTCMIVCWGVVISVGVLWYRHHAGAARARPTADAAQPSPQQTLTGRYARGEMNEAEYSTQLAALRRAVRP